MYPAVEEGMTTRPRKMSNKTKMRKMTEFPRRTSKYNGQAGKRAISGSSYSRFSVLRQRSAGDLSAEAQPSDTAEARFRWL